MLQMVATIVSLLVGGIALGAIVSAMTKDWSLMLQALRLQPAWVAAPLPACARPAAAHHRRVRVLRVRPQSAPYAAAA